MLKNPFLNALMAALYIVVIVLLIQGVAGMTEGKDETILIPMAMLSLFVISASVMGMLFVLTPAQMLLEDQKKEGLLFFLKTLGTFVIFALVFLSLHVFL